MTADRLVIGATGYIGRHLGAASGAVVGSSRQDGAGVRITDGRELDAVLASRSFDQVVFTPQLTADGIDDLLQRVDGPRWIVLSSMQLASAHPAPGSTQALAREAAALERGATVLRPTMVFGRSGDQNVTRLIRWLRTWRVAPVIGSGRQLVQPLHVDDLGTLLDRHRERPLSGCFEVAGDEPITADELIDALAELLGTRFLRVAVPLRILSPILGMLGLRPDQVARLSEDKTADIGAARAAFEWSPEPLAHRLEQAVGEALR